MSRLDAYHATYDDPRTSPLLFPSHTDLPPAHIKICGLDPIRDDGFIYAAALEKVLHTL
jgi:acetyl esterase/lipase